MHQYLLPLHEACLLLCSKSLREGAQRRLLLGLDIANIHCQTPVDR